MNFYAHGSVVVILSKPPEARSATDLNPGFLYTRSGVTYTNSRVWSSYCSISSSNVTKPARDWYTFKSPTFKKLPDPASSESSVRSPRFPKTSSVENGTPDFVPQRRRSWAESDLCGMTCKGPIRAAQQPLKVLAERLRFEF